MLLYVPTKRNCKLQQSSKNTTLCRVVWIRSVHIKQGTKNLVSVLKTILQLYRPLSSSYLHATLSLLHLVRSHFHLALEGVKKVKTVRKTLGQNDTRLSLQQLTSYFGIVWIKMLRRLIEFLSQDRQWHSLIKTDYKLDDNQQKHMGDIQGQRRIRICWPFLKVSPHAAL